MKIKDKFDFENKELQTVNRLTEYGKNFQLKEGVREMAAKRIINNTTKRKPKTKIAFIPSFATTIILLIAVLSVSVLVFPDVAVKYASALPIVRELAEKDDDVNELTGRLDDMQDQISEKESAILYLEAQLKELEIKIKEISKEEITEVITSDNTDEALNIQLQTLVVNFVKAMYRADYNEAAKFCTTSFAVEVKANPQYIIMRKDNAVVFTQITNIARTEDGVYLVFLRLNDSSDGEADYQIDFEIIEKDGKYFISFAGMNA